VHKRNCPCPAVFPLPHPKIATLHVLAQQGKHTNYLARQDPTNGETLFPLNYSEPVLSPVKVDASTQTELSCSKTRSLLIFY
jgi:hypothetical protein